MQHAARLLARAAVVLHALPRAGFVGCNVTIPHKEAALALADIVTDADREVEALIRARLRDARPGDGFLGEESGAERGESDVTWVVDPIDGTVNYLYGHPFYAVSVAVCVGDTAREGAWLPVAGAVAAPELDRTYVAGHGQGAEVVDRAGRRRPLAVSGCKRLELALVGTGFGYEADKRREQGQMLASLLPQVRDVRRAGAAGSGSAPPMYVGRIPTPRPARGSSRAAVAASTTTTNPPRSGPRCTRT